MRGQGAYLAAGLLALLSACASAPPQPLTMPAADGRAAEVAPGDGFRYVVTRRAVDHALGGVVLRVTRAGAPELTYSDGLAAKRAAEAYCGQFNRGLDPRAFGRFSVPASWLFEGGCT